ncbi:MAG: glycosyltransferase [Chitinivibrionales bacterium]|nr:glycosyltransferase [Chitinivibrionales bacterium]MBD3357795.1 glycosyltransferase [Chitinivibrionales bacterium]
MHYILYSCFSSEHSLRPEGQTNISTGIARNHRLMNIAFVNPEYPSRTGRDHGGIATYIFTMANTLAALGHRIYVVARQGTVSDTLDERVEVRRFQSEPIHRLLPLLDRLVDEKIRWERGCSRALRKTLIEIHQEKPLDVVEVPEYNGLAGELPPSLPFPIVVHFHTPTALLDELNGIKPTGKQKKWHIYEAWAVRHAQAYKCSSESLKERLPALSGVPRERIEIIRRPIPTRAFDARRKHHDLTADRIDILFSGRLERRKGSETILSSIQDILRLDPRIRVTFAGETQVGETLSSRTAIERAVSPRERHRVSFLGAVKRHELCTLYCRSSILLMPSLFDNAPYALLEAMAAKLPVAAADVGGVNEIIRHDHNGLLFMPDSPEELVACLRTLIGSPATAYRLAAQAYNDIQNLYAPSTIARQTLSFYERLRVEVKKKSLKDPLRIRAAS